MRIPKMIAMDGPAASGKSTIAEKIAAEIDYLFFDTGVMYRVVTLAVLKNGISVDDLQAVDQLAEKVRIDVNPSSVDDGRKYDVLLDGEDVTWDIRSEKVNANVSKVSAYAGVRKAMTEQQRRIGLRGNVVMVGRDIGTVVLPEADLKIYLDASAEERARRRFSEEKGRGIEVKYDEILASIRKRDAIDSNRVIAPLVPAQDAIIIDTDNLSIDEVATKIKSLFK